MTQTKEVKKEIYMPVRIENHIDQFLRDKARKMGTTRSFLVREILKKEAMKNELQPSN